MKKLISAMLAVSVLCLGGCSKDPDVDPLKRDTDQVSVGYRANATAQFTVRCSGAWEARVVCVDASGTPVENWFSISPENGVGNGEEYQYITVTAKRNGGVARKGYVYLKAQGYAEEQKMEISQDAGIFKVENPAVVGELKTSRASGARLVIAYDKAFGGEKVEIFTTLTGMSVGLSVAEEYATEIEAEGSGEIAIPITGTPEEMGELGFTIVAKLDGKEIYNGKITTPIKSPNEILSMGFDLFLWGGDYPKNKAGVGPDPSIPRLELTGGEKAENPITAGSDAVGDVFNPASMSDVYRKNRGMVGWTGLRVYEHPGYVKMGVTGNGGWIMSPALTMLGSTPSTVVVSIDFLRFDNEQGTYIVSAEGAGAVMNGEVNSTVVPAPDNAANRKWTTVAFTVKEATNQTKIKLSAANMDVTGCRMNIDNFIVMSKAKPVIKDPLDMPDMETLKVTATESSFDLKWDVVKNADLYEVVLTDVTRPQFSFKQRVETPEILIENILPGYYELKLIAVWVDDEKMNSQPATKQIVTKDVRTEPLDTPTNLGCTNKGYTMTAKWGASEGATGYHVILLDGQTEVKSADVTTTSCDFADLEGQKSYTLKVKATFKPNPKLDSPYASAQVATLPHMTAPMLDIFVKSHGLAVVEWALSAKALEEQAIANNKDTYDFRVKNAAGKVVRVIDDFSKFNFAKYSNFRLVWGGLTPGAKYTMEIRRKALATTLDNYVDSEWASVDVTTDAAPNTSGYLLYKDFDNYPCGAQPLYGAYGFSVGSTTDFSNPDAVLLAAGDANSVYTQGVKTTASYFNAYLSEWDVAEWPSVCSNTGIGAGYMKLGGGGNPAWVTLPKFTALTAASTLEVELDSCPYMEPSTAGDMMTPSNADLMEYFYVTVTGGGTITQVLGETASSAVIDEGNTRVMLRNVMVAKMKSEGLTDRYRFTGHKIKIVGATANTRIKIYTALEKEGSKNFRMWLDNIKVKRAN